MALLTTSAMANSPGLSKGKIGPLNVGVHLFHLAHLDQNAKVRRKQFEEDFQLEYRFNIKNVGIINVLLEADDTSVYRLSTSAESLKTVAGGKVGMTLKALKKIYPNGKLDVAWDGIDSAYHFILPNEEGFFAFDATDIIKPCGKAYPDCGKLLQNHRSTAFITF